MLRKIGIKIILSLLALLMLGPTAFAAPASQLIKDGDVHNFTAELSNMYITQHNVSQHGESIYRDNAASLDIAVRLMTDLALEAYGVNGALTTQFLYGDVDFAEIRIGYMADLYQVFYYDSTSCAQVIYIQYYPQMNTAWYGLIDIVPETHSACQAMLLDRTNAGCTASNLADAAGIRSAYELLAAELTEAFTPVESNCSRCDGTGLVTEACPACSGAGKRSVNCGECGGDGQRNCSYCGGSGRKECDNCDGDGIGNCSRCYGRGTTGGRTCSRCRGSGLGECPFCDGSGTEYCTPTYRCKDCNSGKISVTCGDCSGSGESYADCPVCAGTGKVTQSAGLTVLESTPLNHDDITTAGSHTGEHQEAVDYSAQIAQAQTYSKRIAAGMFHTLGIQADGTVYGAGNPNLNRTKFSDCKNVVQVAAGEDFGVCLLADGTVLARGENSYGECRTSAWRNIVDIAAGKDHLVGLKKDGTVVATGWSENDVSSWSDIIAVEASSDCSAGLKRDGTVVVTDNRFPEATQWRDIVSIGVGKTHIVGLQSNGTLLVDNYFSDDDPHPAEAWTGIIDIACYTPPEELAHIPGGRSVHFDYVVGLRADGTIMAASLTEDPAFVQTVSEWKDIVAIEGGTNLIGITSDGQVLTAGPDIYDWTWNREGFTDPPAGKGRNAVNNWDLIE